MIKSPTIKMTLVLFLGAIACFSAYTADKTTLAMVVGAFIALLKQD